MPNQDTKEIKQKIINVINSKGPSLPVHISKEIDQSILFTSAFLSELLSEKKLTTSNLRVGSSPLYFIPGQETRLEKFSDNIKGKEKEAFLLLQQKKFLKDSDQQPAIRVALRAIKDFAIPFEKNQELYWRYFTSKLSNLEEKPKEEANKKEIQKKENQNTKEEEKLDIFEKKSTKKKTIKKKTTKKSSEKKNEKFFNKVKEYVSKNSLEIIDIEGFSKSDLTLKVKTSEGEKLLIAYNKKRLTEQDIIKAHKKAKEKNMDYLLISLGEPLKKTTNFIEAIKNLYKIDKIE